MIERHIAPRLRRALADTPVVLLHGARQTGKSTLVHAGREVDIVLEDHSGRVVGIEVKASATLGANDVKGLRALAALAGERFHRGIVLYAGRDVIPFAARIHAVPLNALWAR